MSATHQAHPKPSKKSETRESKVRQYLARQSGRCYICGELIDVAVLKAVEIDHIVPTTAGGPDVDTNKMAAHTRCNRIKKALGDVSKARALINLIKVSEAKSFKARLDDFLHFLEKSKRRTQVTISKNAARVLFDGHEQDCMIINDPTISDLQYIFVLCPLQYIDLELEMQPRFIEEHLSGFLIGTWEQPFLDVCHGYLKTDDKGFGSILLFNGQHRVVASILSKRPAVDLKLYLNPTREQLDILHRTNIDAHERFRQRPVQAPIAAQRLKEIWEKDWEAFLNNPRFVVKSEREFFRTRPTERVRLMTLLRKWILDTAIRESNIQPYVEMAKGSSREYPFTYSTLEKSFIARFTNPNPYEVDLNSVDSDNPRVIERDNIVTLMDIYAEQIIRPRWKAPLKAVFRKPDDPTFDINHHVALRLTRSSVLRVICEELAKAIRTRLVIWARDRRELPVSNRLLNAPERETFGIISFSQAYEIKEAISHMVEQIVHHNLWYSPHPDIDRIIQAVSPEDARILITQGKFAPEEPVQFSPLTAAELIQAEEI
jgi:hypothetical protein